MEGIDLEGSRSESSHLKMNFNFTWTYAMKQTIVDDILVYRRTRVGHVENLRKNSAEISRERHNTERGET